MKRQAIAHHFDKLAHVEAAIARRRLAAPISPKLRAAKFTIDSALWFRIFGTIETPGTGRGHGHGRTVAMPKICTVEAALADGYTRELFATSDVYDHNLLAKPDVDLDDRFLAYDTDQHEWIRINGWLYTFEDATGFVIGPHDGIMRKIG